MVEHSQIARSMTVAAHYKTYLPVRKPFELHVDGSACCMSKAVEIELPVRYFSVDKYVPSCFTFYEVRQNQGFFK